VCVSPRVPPSHLCLHARPSSLWMWLSVLLVPRRPITPHHQPTTTPTTIPTNPCRRESRLKKKEVAVVYKEADKATIRKARNPETAVSRSVFKYG
jgi:hypothetical protein